MKARYAVLLAGLAGVGIGVGLTQTLHAQAKPPGYWVASIDISDEAAYTKEAAPMLGKAIREQGGKYIVRGGRTAVLEGMPPSKRFVIIQFSDFEKVQAAYKSAAYQEGRKVGDKYAKYNIFAAEGTAE